MTGESFFNHASIIFTVISFVVFVGILWWTFSSRRKADFDAAAKLPFLEEAGEYGASRAETNHG